LITTGAAQVDHFDLTIPSLDSIPIQTAGIPFYVQVIAKDSINNTVTSFTGTIQMSSNGLLLGPVVSKPFVNGVLDSMTIIFKNTGLFFLVATNTDEGQTGISNEFSVVPNAPFAVGVETAPDGTGAVLATQSVTAGRQLVAYAIVRDSLNNFINLIGADSWTLQNITGGVTASDLVPSGDRRAAFFTGHKTGTAQIHAISGSLRSINSGTVTVTSGAASRLSFVQQPSNTINNSPITPSVTVQLEDAQGNAVSTAGDTITLSLIGTGTLQGSTQQLTDTTGLASYSGLNINLLGTKRLAATGGSLTPDTSTTFTILPGPVNNFLVESSSGGSIPTETAGAPFTIRVTARDLAGNTATSFTGKIQISSTAILLNTIVSVPFVNGVLDSMAVSIGNTGSFSLTATSTSGPQTGVSNVFSVAPNLPFKINVESASDGTGTVVVPQSVTAGQTVTAYAITRDSLNNFIANVGADTWTLQNSTGGVLLTDLVAGGDRKSAQFTGHKIGSAQLHVTSGTLNSTNSGTLTVTAGAAARVGFIQQPTAAVSDSGISPPVTVQVEDIGGNAVPGSGDSITVSLIGTGSLQGPVKVQANVTGLATFSGLTIDLIGTKRLTASANAFISDTSTSFVISPGPATSFLVEASSGGVIPTQTAGTPFSIRVTARDQGGNTATGFSGTVNITSSGTLSAGGDTTPVFVSGVLASYSVTMLQGGTFTITATQTSGSASGTSGPFAVNNPVPTTTSITPNLKTVLDAGFTLTVNGTNFVPTSTAQINGSDRTTTFVNGTQITVSVLSGDLSTAETLAVTVTSPTPGGGLSNSQQLVVANLTTILKVYLQGPFSAGSMSTALRTSGVVPLSQPYSASPWNYSGTEHVAAIPANVVDWLLLELRTGTTGTTKVATRAGFLLSNGSVVDLDGSSPVTFTGIGAGNYYVVLRHRNHIAAMSASPLPLSAASASYDFTAAQTRAFGTTPMASLAGGVFGLYAGDVTANGTLKYSGGGNDSGPIYARIGGGSVSATVSGYFPEDTNMNGIVKYSGAQNDRAIIYANIGGGSVSATLTTQVPP